MNKLEMGDMIKNAMISQGYTVRTLAKELEMSHPQIIRITKGEANYNIDTLFKIINKLNLDLKLIMSN